MDPGAIVSTFSGVRPLLAGDRETSDEMSRDYSCARVDLPGSSLPVFSMAGGKWTTFRAFAEETADVVLDVLGGAALGDDRATVPIGGGRDYPLDASARAAWLERLSRSTGLPVERVEVLLERYGTQGGPRSPSTPGARATDRSRTVRATPPRRSSWIIRNEKVRRLDDLVLRRTNLALLGQLSMPLLEELAQLWASELGLPASDPGGGRGSHRRPAPSALRHQHLGRDRRSDLEPCS